MLWDEVEEEDTTPLSTLVDAFRRQLDDSGDEGERDGKGSEEEEEVHSDGEVGIGLSLMGALDGEDDEDEGVEPAKKTKGEKDAESGAGDVGVGVRGNVTGVAGENGGTTPMTWTRYTPTSPISPKSPHGPRKEEDEEGGNEEEDEDDGAYWDDIYDDYRYSRYSLASKRFSAASKASGVSKASSKARTNAPPMPVPPDRPSVDASRPSIGSDGTAGHPRPSLESSSSSMSASMPFRRPSLSRSMSDDSTHETTMLPLTAQFPAVPEHVPVRTESRLRIVHDGYTPGGDDHGERELHVEHGSTEEESREVGFNIEVIEAADEDDEAQGQEVVAGRPFTSANAQMALSPLLHTTFGSPHSSRFTDMEDGSSDQDHGRRYSNKSGKSMMSSVEGSLKSPMEGGGMASALRAKMEAERTPSSGTASSPVGPASAPKSSSSEEPGVRAIVVDDDEGHVTGVNILINDPSLATEAGSLLPIPSTQTLSVSPATVVTDPAPQATSSAEPPDDGEKSTFLRLRPQASQSPHPFARTSIFLPHPNAPKAVPQSQGPMYGRTAAQTTYPTPPLEPSATHQPSTTTTSTPPGTTLYSAHIFHQLRSLVASLGPAAARRPPMTVFARCQSELNASMGPVPILFSLDPFPAWPASPPPPTTVGSGHGVTGSLTPTRAATVSAPVRSRGAGDDVPPTPSERGSGVADVSTLRLPKRSATTVVGSVGGPQGVVAGPPSSLSPSLPIPREGFVPRVGAARPRSRSFSAFGANGPVAAPQERRSVQSSYAFVARKY